MISSAQRFFAASREKASSTAGNHGRGDLANLVVLDGTPPLVEVGVCAVVVAEFYAGLSLEQRPKWDDFFGALPFWEASREAARQAGIWRYEFARKGTQLSTADLLVAAVASQREAVIATNNVKDYPMGQVNVLPLRDAPSG